MTGVSGVPHSAKQRQAKRTGLSLLTLSPPPRVPGNTRTPRGAAVPSAWARDVRGGGQLPWSLVREPCSPLRPPRGCGLLCGHGSPQGWGNAAPGQTRGATTEGSSAPHTAPHVGTPERASAAHGPPGLAPLSGHRRQPPQATVHIRLTPAVRYSSGPQPPWHRGPGLLRESGA